MCLTARKAEKMPLFLNFTGHKLSVGHPHKDRVMEAISTGAYSTISPAVKAYFQETGRAVAAIIIIMDE